MILNPAGEGTGVMLFSGVFDSKENGEEGIGVNSLGLSWSGVGDKGFNEASEEGQSWKNLLVQGEGTMLSLLGADSGDNGGSEYGEEGKSSTLSLVWGEGTMLSFLDSSGGDSGDNGGSEHGEEGKSSRFHWF